MYANRKPKTTSNINLSFLKESTDKNLKIKRSSAMAIIKRGLNPNPDVIEEKDSELNIDVRDRNLDIDGVLNKKLNEQIKVKHANDVYKHNLNYLRNIRTKRA